MARLKVAMVTSSLSRDGGGVSAVVEALSRGVAETGLAVAVFGSEDKGWLAGDLVRWNGAPATALPIAGPRSLAYAPQLTQRLIDWSPDVVHVHGIWTASSYSVTQWARATGMPYMISPHGMLESWAIQNARWKKRIAGVLFEHGHLRRASCLHALCDAETNAIRSYGLKNKICVIPNGVASVEEAAARPAPWSGEFPADARVMLFLGRLHPKKNLEQFVRAWSRLADSDRKPWCLAIAGWDQGGHEAYLRGIVRELGLELSIVFLGPLFGANKEAAYRNASAFVLPSLSEGLPMTVLEAWAHGLPVLMTDACNLPEGFEEGAAEHLDLSEGGMVDGLKRFFLLDEASLDLMRRCARAIVARHFQWPIVSSRFAQVYRWLRENGETPSCVIQV